MAGDFDFMCINTDKSLEPIIKPADIIALKKYTTWETYIPGDFICVVVTKDYIPVPDVCLACLGILNY